MDEKEFQLEKLKLKFNILKFWISTVLIGTIILVVNWTFQFKEVKMQEIEKQNEYLTQFIDYVIDKDLEKRRDIAQYLSDVSINKKSRKRWSNYYLKTESLIKEKIELKNKIIKNINEYNKLTSKQNIELHDTIFIDTIDIHNNFNNEFDFNNGNNTIEKAEKLKQKTDSLKLILATLESIDNDKINELEYNSFNYILNKDYDNAIIKLNEVMEINPYYHCIYEIKTLLIKSKNELKTNSNYWFTIYEIILEKYDWGMPKEIKDKMQLETD